MTLKILYVNYVTKKRITKNFRCAKLSVNPPHKIHTHRLRNQKLAMGVVDDVCGRNGTQPFIMANVDAFCVPTCTRVGRRGLTKGPVSGYKRGLCAPYILRESGRVPVFLLLLLFSLNWQGAFRPI